MHFPIAFCWASLGQQDFNSITDAVVRDTCLVRAGFAIYPVNCNTVQRVHHMC